MKNTGLLPLHLCEPQGALDSHDPPFNAELGSARHFHGAGRYNGLHLVKPGALDPHPETPVAVAPQRSRFGKAVDVMLGRAEVRPARAALRQSWRA